MEFESAAVRGADEFVPHGPHTIGRQAFQGERKVIREAVIGIPDPKYGVGAHDHD